MMSSKSFRVVWGSERRSFSRLSSTLLREWTAFGLFTFSPDDGQVGCFHHLVIGVVLL